LNISEIIRDGSTLKHLRSHCYALLFHTLRVWVLWQQSQKESYHSSQFPELVLTLVCRGLKADSSREELNVQLSCLRSIHVLVTFLKKQRIESKKDDSLSELFHSKFLSAETVKIIWGFLSRSNSNHMPQKCLMASTLVAISCYDSSALITYAEKSGVPGIIAILINEANKHSTSKDIYYLQLVTTILNTLLQHDSLALKLAQNKEFITHLLALTDCTSLLVRSKALLALKSVLAVHRESLVQFCNGKLISFLEREIKQLGSRWKNRTEQNLNWKNDESLYLMACLNNFVEHLNLTCHKILIDSSDILRQVSGRKHPSTNQSASLKHSLPLIFNILKVLSSSLLRPILLMDTSFVLELNDILSEIPNINSKVTNLDPALGTGTNERVIKVILDLYEIIAVSSKALAPSFNTSETEFLNESKYTLLINGILPCLASILTGNNSHSIPHVISLLTHLLSPVMICPMVQLHSFIIDKILPALSSAVSNSLHQFVPSLGLSLLHMLFVLSPHPINVGDIPENLKLSLADCIRSVVKINLEQPHIITPTMVQALSLLSTILASSAQSSSLWNIVHDDWNIVGMLVKVAQIAEIEPDSESMSILELQFIEALLTLLQTVVQYVADQIRSVLSSRKSGSRADTNSAESLLLQHHPLIRVFSPLLHCCMVHTDDDLASIAIDCLSQLCQLFGVEHHPTLTLKHMQIYASALSHPFVASSATLKNFGQQKQRTILKILKKLIIFKSTDKLSKKFLQVSTAFQLDKKENGPKSLHSILNRISQVAASSADVTMAYTAEDILARMENH